MYNTILLVSGKPLKYLVFTLGEKICRVTTRGLEEEWVTTVSVFEWTVIKTPLTEYFKELSDDLISSLFPV